MMNNKFRNGHGKPVVSFDIDGSLGSYHRNFLEFSERWLGRDMPDVEEMNPGLPLWKHMHITKTTYRQIKLAYRQSGAKRWMPAFPYADALTKKLSKLGAEIWICTTRPYLRLDNIDPDTREWLRRNHIHYDAVIFGEDKYKELVRQVDPSRIICILEDLPEMVDQAISVGLDNILLQDQPYNRHFDRYPSQVRRIHTLNPESEIWLDIGARTRSMVRDVPSELAP